MCARCRSGYVFSAKMVRAKVTRKAICGLSLTPTLRLVVAPFAKLSVLVQRINFPINHRFGFRQSGVFSQAYSALLQ